MLFLADGFKIKQVCAKLFELESYVNAMERKP